tara:strand:- start:3761 stop:6625 length:2865 start_codon:yes stop_codon:yes gene_type:complete
MAVQKGFQRGDRTTVVTPKLGVIKSSKSNIGDIISGIGEMTEKLTLNKIEVLDEQWKTQFKSDTDTFLYDVTNQQLDSADPDLQSMKTQIVSYKDTLLQNSPERYKSYIANYVDQKSLAKFNTVKNHADKILIKSTYDDVNSDKNRILKDLENTLSTVNLTVDPTDPQSIALQTDVIMMGITNDIADFSKKLQVLSELDPYNFGEVEIQEQLDNLFYQAELGRYKTIKRSFYNNIDFTSPDVLDQIQEADAKVALLDQDYASGEIFRSSNTITDTDVAQIINDSNSDITNLKGLYQSQIDVANQDLQYKRSSEISTLKNIIEITSVNNIKQLLLTGEVALESLIKGYDLENDSDLINTMTQKMSLLEILKKQDIDINQLSIYSRVIKENNIGLFENDEDLKKFLTDYKVAEIEISNPNFNALQFINELPLPTNQRSAQSNDLLNMMVKENIVPSIMYDYLNQTNSIITNPEFNPTGETEGLTIIRSVQFLEFMTQENPLAIQSFNEEIDMGFYNFALNRGGSAYLDIAGVNNVVKLYKNNKEEIDKNPKFIDEEIEKLIIDNDTIEESLNNILIDFVLGDTAENIMWLDLVNSVKGEYGFPMAESLPIDAFIQSKTGVFITDPKPNVVEKGFVSLSNNAAALLDNVLPGQPLTATNAKIFYEYAPEARDFLNNIIYTKLKNSMDLSDFINNPDKAKEQAEKLMPDILTFAFKKLYQNNYSVSNLSSDLDQPTLIKNGIETNMVKMGYNQKDAGYYLATQVKIALTDMQNSQSLKGDKKWFMDNLGFLYAPNGEYKEPTVRDIYEQLNQFQFKPIPGGNVPEYQIFIRNNNSLFHGQALQNEKEAYIMQIDSPNVFDPDAPKTFDDVKYLRHSTILQDKNSFVNKAFPFMPRYMKRNLMEIFEVGRPITDALLEPFAEFVTIGNYNWENLREEYDKYIDTQLITPIEEVPEVALQ